MTAFNFAFVFFALRRGASCFLGIAIDLFNVASNVSLIIVIFFVCFFVKWPQKTIANALCAATVWLNVAGVSR